MDISALNFEHLKPFSVTETVQHPSSYIKEGKNQQATRRIFCDVPFDAFEKKQLRDFRSLIAEQGIRLPQEWTENETLKHLYSSKFDFERTLKDLNVWKDWRGDPVSRKLTPGVLALYENGTLYTYGKDRQLRPIVILDCGKINLNTTRPEEFNAALTILLDTLARFCYSPGKIENCTFIIDTRKFSMLQLPLLALQNWIMIGNACFPCSSHKIYVVGPPSILKKSWLSVQSLMDTDTAQKIEFVESYELKRLQVSILSSQLEEKFGGSLPSLTSYWPPKSPDVKPGDRSQWSLQSLQEIDDGLAHSTPSLILHSKGQFDLNETGSFCPGPKEIKNQNQKHTVAGKVEPIGLQDARKSYPDKSPKSSPPLNRSLTRNTYGQKDDGFLREMMFSTVELSPSRKNDYSTYRSTTHIDRPSRDNMEEEKKFEKKMTRQLHNLTPGHYVTANQSSSPQRKNIHFSEVHSLTGILENENNTLRGSAYNTPRKVKEISTTPAKQKLTLDPNTSPFHTSETRLSTSYQSSGDLSMQSLVSPKSCDVKISDWHYNKKRHPKMDPNVPQGKDKKGFCCF